MVDERVAATGLLAPGRPVVVLLSGGRDSVCLLGVAAGLGAAVTALHVNYGLRDTAAGDEALCAELCARLGVALEVRSPRRPEGGGNVQAWARDVRYAEATRLALARGADCAVATGHTTSDQAETILYRLAASPGRRALLGMPERAGRLVRPLLAAGVTREDTAAWCRARGLPWAEDPSNAGEAYARSRVRHGLLAALREIHPAAEANLVRTAGLLRDEAAVLDEAVATALAGRDRIAVARLAQLPPALARLVLVRLAEAAGATFVPGAAGHLAEVLAAPEGARVAVGGGVDLVVEGGWVRTEHGRPQPPPAVALGVPGEVAFGAWTVCAAPSAPEPRDGVLGFAAHPPPLVVRAWRHGDRMAPLGMGGHTRTLQDLFTDRRIPRAARATIPVVECGGEIAWIPGVATSERFRVTAETAAAVALDARG